MPGKLPGGKVRISSTPPSIISKTKNPSTSEVQYFGLVRDEYLNDLTSNADAIEQVLEDIQDSAERKAVAEMKVGDLAIIDGIVNFNIKKEDLATLGGASLNDEDNNALVNPRYRLADRIKQFESFTGRGINFIGSGPTRFTYIVPKEGDLLIGSVSITTSGKVTGTGTAFSNESLLTDPNQQLNRTLEVGDYVYLCEEDGTTLHKVGTTPAEKAQDQAIYKVTAVTSNTDIDLDPAPPLPVSGGKKLRKRYCNNVIPPFFSEPIDSTKFNAPETIPSAAVFKESHRLGYLLDGVYTPLKDKESWWEGKYNLDFHDRSEYGDEAESSSTNPKFPIVKDGNLNFAESFETLPQQTNVGLKYDFLLKRGDLNSAVAKWRAQVNGHLRIDYWEHTSYDSDGNSVGSWKTAIDTTNANTYFRQVQKEEITQSRLGFKEYYLQGGPDLKDVAAVEAQSPNNSVNNLLTYLDEEGNTLYTFNNYVPVVVRYWYGQDTVDESLEDYKKINSTLEPSFALDYGFSNISYDSTDPTAGNNKYWNSFFGNYELEWNATDSVWEVVASTEPNYKQNLSDLAHSFEIIAWSNLNEGTAPAAVSEADKTLDTYLATLLAFENASTEVLGGKRAVDTTTTPDSLSTSQLDVTFDGIDTTGFVGGEKIYALFQNRPVTIRPKDPLNEPAGTPYFSVDELWQRYIFSPDPNGAYTGAADMLYGGTNFVEPNPERVEYESNPEYFKYKHGIKPTLNTYGVDRYDGFIKNRINGTADTDYAHSKLMPIGRQKKATGPVDEYTGNNVPNPLPLADTDGDSTPDEVRNRGENYTFISVEEDQAGNGGNVTINAFPANTLASVFNTASEDNGGKLLHSADNSLTYGNGVRQNNNNIQTNLQLPLSSNFDDSGDFTGPSYSMKFVNINSGAKLLFYPAKYSANTITAEEYDGTTRGMVSTSGLGIADVGAGTNGRTKANKSIYLYKFDKFKYDSADGITADTTETRYFIDFLLATRPNADASVTPIEATPADPNKGTIVDGNLFGNFGIADATELTKVYDGTLIEFYQNSDALGNSGNQIAGEDSPVATAYVVEYDPVTEAATYEVISGTPPALTAPHSVRLYYNYFEVTKVPAKLTDASGALQSGGESALSGTTDSSTMRLWFVYNAGLGFARADNGQGLSFAETLYVNPDVTGIANPQVFPFGPNTELPSPPSATVTPFDFDNSPTTPGNPGLGGLCYPPYQTQEVTLKDTVANDTTLYAATEGQYDFYFGSPQVSSTNLGNKYLQVNDEFSFDFSEAERPNIIPEGADLTALVPNFPVFNSGAYTHKLKVNLTPYIGAPDTNGNTENTGLFSRSAYNSLDNDNIFKDCLIFSNEKPVKEVFYLFAKKTGGETQGPISILTANDPAYT